MGGTFCYSTESDAGKFRWTLFIPGAATSKYGAKIITLVADTNKYGSNVNSNNRKDVYLQHGDLLKNTLLIKGIQIVEPAFKNKPHTVAA